MRILLTGSGGQIGHELAHALAPFGDIIAPSRADIDLAKTDVLVGRVRELHPDVIVNAAAYTRVDEAEIHRDLARTINTRAPALLAEEARRSGALLVHYSTDYVFDGRKAEPYGEEDPAAPLNVYGETKLAGEQAIRESGARHLILRISWVYGLHRTNFLTTMLRLFRQQEEVAVVDDQIGGPTWSRSIAEATGDMLTRLIEDGPGGGVDLGGTYNLSASSSASWFTFASAILDRIRVLAGEDDPIVTRRVVAITSDDYPTPARRPRNSLLSNRKIQLAFGISLPSWRDQLDACLAGVSP